MLKYICVFFLLALGIRLGIASQDFVYLDRLFLPDDTYYTLTISRFIHQGFGPSVDGVILTSGFQPLITLFQLPLFSLFSDPDQIAHIAVYESAIFGALSTILIALLLRRVEAFYTPIIGMLLWAIAPLAIAGDLNGLETSLSGLVNLCIVYSALRVDESRSPGWSLAMGVFCALGLVTRIDTCFVIALVGLFGLYQWGFRQMLIIAGTALLVISPWWIYLYHEFGSFIPESGAAIQQIFSLGTGGSVLMRAFAAGIGVLKVAEWFSPSFTHVFIDYPLRLLGLVVIFMMMRRSWKILAEARMGVLQALFISQLILFFFYLFIVPGYWFFSRYFYTLFMVLTLALAIGAGAVLKQYGGNVQQAFKASRFWGLSLVFVMLASLSHQWHFFSKPDSSAIIKLSTFRGYRDIAKGLLTDLPPNSIMGASQSGALGYYAPQGTRVVNLDGVVNRDAYLAVKNRELKKYLQSVNISHVAEYKIQDSLPDVFGAPFDEACLGYISSVPHGHLQFSLYNIEACLR